MDNDINIAEILKDCPNGTKLYSPLFGNVQLISVEVNKLRSISTKDKYLRLRKFTSEGVYEGAYLDTETMLFPSSEMRNWNRFFKHGDVIYNQFNNSYSVFDRWYTDSYTAFVAAISLFGDNRTDKGQIWATENFVKANEVKRDYFIKKVEEILHGKYNPETLSVEPVNSKCPFRPFDKVLVRDDEEQVWYANYFSHCNGDEEYPYECIDTHYRYCIPYEGNEHLLGTQQTLHQIKQPSL